MVKYLIRDAVEGIRRNAGATVAAAFLIFITLTLAGVLMLIRFGVDETLLYLQSQATLKVYVDPAIDPEQVVHILKSKSFVLSAEVETKEQLLEQLKHFFADKQYLLDSFKESSLPNAIRLELNNNSQPQIILDELRMTKGIIEVIYPQEYAETVLQWSTQLNRYGMAMLGMFAAIAFLTVYVALNLAFYQRQREVRVKLLLGAKPAHVRGQFLLEGCLIGWMGSLPAAITVYYVFQYVLFHLEKEFYYIFSFSDAFLYSIMFGIMGVGSLLSLFASYISTRKCIQIA